MDLLLLKKEFNSHFVLVKNFSRLLSSQVVRNGHETFFCKSCLNSFRRVEKLEEHKKICGEFEPTKIEVPGGVCSFRNFQKIMHVAVVGYADFESILKPISEKKEEGGTGGTGGTVKTHEHVPLRIRIPSRFPIFANGTRVEKSKR